ncbi:hypothetical protein [Dyella nitratireducens]|uniref:Uncharacterized protein n=1 Tax=Dyella nitratireducens TaxID=1849580 RepID=A0ABQ1FUJ4_9GAMM|nr:hypothetical protein [Dyella nitratireducens]GGA29143.1 hypothetical protein GCM10010981_17500 [Dyella nitratireducens]GLQ43185.1 hypothetical protein GCM10007902_30350 [Dyella nitratireducens]
MARDDFSLSTKKVLAQRAGHRCSFPECGAITAGPSKESKTATANTGEAAHISAASSGKGSRRYDPSLTPAQRASIDNGIWCCSTHAKLIDKDEVTYTVKMLKQWRVLAEKRAQLRQAYGDNAIKNHGELLSTGLAEDSVALEHTPDINEKIGIAVKNSWISDICGEEVARTLRDFVIEYARNAFMHGAATTLRVDFNQDSITVEDDGGEFQVVSLLSEDSCGGGMAFRALLATKQLGYASSRRTGDKKNHLHIPFVTNPLDLPKANPCAISLSRQDAIFGHVNFSNLLHCDRIFIVAQGPVSYSDIPHFAGIARNLQKGNPKAILILPDVSRGVIARFREIYPSITIDTW